jgi:hypothetical protein
MTPYCFWHDLRPFAFLFTLEYFLDLFEYQGIGPLYCAIGLEVTYLCEYDLHSDLLTKILEHCTVEVLCVVDYDVSGDAVMADDVLPKEFSDFCRGYIGERLCFDPLHEIFDRHYGEGVVALRWG